jgi:hypothetical protein
MKKTVRTFAASALVCAAAFVTFVACSKDDTPTDETVAVTGVTISPATAQTIPLGGTLNLTATVTPDNATNKAVTWTSSATATATVSATGVVTARADGETTITVTTADGNKTASVTVTVLPEPEFYAPGDPIAAPSAGGTYEIVVTSNIAWTVAVDAASTSWCTAVATFESGISGDGTVTVTVRSQSPNAAARTATVTFTMDEFNPQNVSVNQNAGITARACTQCLWDGSAWVDGYVSERFGDGSTSETSVSLYGGPKDYVAGATSSVDGRANTAAMIAANIALEGSAIKICESLGEGWYLPAYEELFNISSFQFENWWAVTSLLNGRSGAGLLEGNDFFWSSTEYYNNGGRINSTTPESTDGTYGSDTHSNCVVRASQNGYPSGTGVKNWGGAAFFVWRP